MSWECRNCGNRLEDSRDNCPCGKKKPTEKKEQSLQRIAIALERIADALEKERLPR